MNEYLTFKFTEDRFGFSSEKDTFGLAYARDIEAALNQLGKTIKTLFGSPAAEFGSFAADGFCLLGAAGLLPRHPDWESIEGKLQFVSAFNEEVTKDQDETFWKNGEGRQVLINLRDYLKLLQDWAAVLKLGIWASLIASVGSVEDSPLARRRTGLQALGRVFQFDLADSTGDIFSQLKKLTGAVDTGTSPRSEKAEQTKVGSSWAAADPVWQRLLAKGSDMVAGGKPLSFDKPASLTSWLNQLNDDLKGFLELPSAAIGASKTWALVELDYWDQWVWSNDGPPKRVQEPLRVTFLDLMYTACHGGIPFIPSTGRNLSIAQWSRILSEALRRGIPTQDVKESAASNLGVPELRSLSRTGDKLNLVRPIIAVSPQSAQSRASAWQPQSGMGAVALPSSDMRSADALAERRVVAGEAWSGSDPLADMLRDRTTGASITQFIELDDDKVLADDAGGPVQIARPSISLFYFGFGEYSREPFLLGPRSVADLLKLARKQYSHLLPSDLAERSFWARVRFFFRQTWSWLLRSMRRLSSGRFDRPGSSDS